MSGQVVEQNTVSTLLMYHIKARQHPKVQELPIIERLEKAVWIPHKHGASSCLTPPPSIHQPCGI